MKLETLQRFVGSGNVQKASFKRQVKKALDELTEVGLLRYYEMAGDLVTVYKAKPRLLMHKNSTSQIR